MAFPEKNSIFVCKLFLNARIMKFAIIGNPRQAHKSAHAKELLKILKKFKAEVMVEAEFYDYLLKNKTVEESGLQTFEGDNFQADMVISLGGDGTFLKAASLVGAKNTPILGINLGRLGFLADVSSDAMEDALAEIYNNHYRTEERVAIRLDIEGMEIANPYALNDIAILRRDSSSMIAIHTYVGNDFLNTYQADGLIVATPTGSTAYSLSAGGPIIVPRSHALAITPIAPHSLNCRPIVIRDDWEITLQVESRSQNFLVAVDGRNQTCKEGTVLHISKAKHTIKVVKRFDTRFFDTLRQKMMWGLDAR